MTSRKTASLTAAAALAALTAFAPAAKADTVVMGSPLVTPYDGGVSGGASTTSVQLSFSPGTSTNPVVSPANGVITEWKVKSADDGAVYTLKVLRANGAPTLATATNSSFTGVRSVQAPFAVPAGTGVATPTGQIFTYPGQLIPISEGDYIGILTGGADDDLPQATTNGIPQNLIANNFSAQPVDGATANLLSDQQHELLLQATIQYCDIPNLKSRKTKPAKQLLVAGDCAVRIVRKKTNKKKFRGKVLKQKPAGGETAPPGTAVKIVIGSKKS